jgi:hypothetical protein
MHGAAELVTLADVPLPPESPEDTGATGANAETTQQGDAEKDSSDGDTTSKEDYDAEAEEALASTVYRAQQDPLACYDVDVADEEAALQDLKAWLATPPRSEKSV